jgi:hypothetical protein
MKLLQIVCPCDNICFVHMRSPTIPGMTEPEVAALMAELRAYCQGERGRHRALAREIGVREDVLANWLRLHRRPSLENWLKLQAFAKKMRRRRK